MGSDQDDQAAARETGSPSAPHEKSKKKKTGDRRRCRMLDRKFRDEQSMRTEIQRGGTNQGQEVKIRTQRGQKNSLGQYSRVQEVQEVQEVLLFAQIKMKTKAFIFRT